MMFFKKRCFKLQVFYRFATAIKLITNLKTKTIVSILLHSLLIALCCKIVFISQPCYAGEDKNNIIFGMREAGWPPYMVANTQPGNEGIVLDIVRQIANDNGYSLSIMLLPEKRVIQNLKTGNVNAILKAEEWVDDPSLYLWTDPIMISEDVFVFYKQDANNYSSIDACAGMNIGVLLGYGYPTIDPLFKANILKPYVVNTAESLILMLKADRLDAIVLNRHVAYWIIQNSKSLSKESFSYSSFLIDTALFRLALHKGKMEARFIRQFNDKLSVIKKDGRFNLIIKRYVSPH